MQKFLLRAVGEFEVYEFLESVDEFTTFCKANLNNFNIFELAVLSEVETTEIDKEFTVYDMTLEHTGDHFWLIKDENTGMYEPVSSEEQVQNITKHLKEAAPETETVEVEND